MQWRGLILSVFVAGCSTATPAPQVAVAPITCSTDCAAKWSRAVAWVAQNSQYKIQTQTDSLIQTMGPLDSDPAPAFTITKAAMPGGAYEITFAGGCDNFIGCIPTIADARADFAKYVNGM